MTAVEWLINQINSSEWQDKYIWHKEEIFKEAKQMENERLLDKYGEGYDEGMYDALNK